MAFLAKAVTGDFGTSLYTKQPVFTVIMERFPATVLMTGTAMIVASIIGILIGVASARRAGSHADAAISAASLLGYSLPGFWVGQLLVLLFAVVLDWFPADRHGGRARDLYRLAPRRRTSPGTWCCR